MGTVIATVGVGTNPSAVAIDVASGLAYVTNFGSGNVTVINRSVSVASIDMGPYSFPSGVAYDSNNSTVWVASYGFGTVTMFSGAAPLDTSSGTLFACDSNPARPLELTYVPASGRGYTTAYGGSSVQVLRGFPSNGGSCISVGQAPRGMAYDSSTGTLYVANSGSNNVSLINVWRVVGTLTVGQSPWGVAYDPASRLVYVTNSGSSSVTVFNGTSEVATVAVGGGPEGVAYDPANGLVYVANSRDNSVSVINGTAVTGTIPVGKAPRAIACDPVDGYLYVTNYDGNTVSVISSLLSISPLNMSPIGTPADSVDVGQTVFINATVPALGAGALNITTSASLSTGLGCAPSVNVTYASLVGRLSLRCSPTIPSLYPVRFDVQDANLNVVWARIDLAVAPSPVALTPTASHGTYHNASSGDVNQTVVFSALSTGGSGQNWVYAWTGLPFGGCLRAVTATPVCFLSVVTNLTIGFSVTDSNGGSSRSPLLHFRVYGSPLAVAPVALPDTTDVGQTVEFVETPASFGSGGLAFAWGGFAGGTCTALASGTPSCVFTSIGTLSIDVTIRDSNGETATSPPLALTVHSEVEVSSIATNRTSADVGQSILWTATPSGGAGGYVLEWFGLPSDCLDLNSSTPSCVVTRPGNIDVAAQVLDASGALSPLSEVIGLPVYTDPYAGVPQVSASSVQLGAPITIREDVSGGLGPYRYVWSGLPRGCSGNGPRVDCYPTQTGVFLVSVIAKDANGFTVTGESASLIVSPIIGPSLVDWLRPPVVYGLATDIGAVLLVAMMIAFRGWRNRTRGCAERLRSGH